jgi:hypothetical protein
MPTFGANACISAAGLCPLDTAKSPEPEGASAACVSPRSDRIKVDLGRRADEAGAEQLPLDWAIRVVQKAASPTAEVLERVPPLANVLDRQVRNIALPCGAPLSVQYAGFRTRSERDLL